jgi:hypothetical protein
MGLCPSPTPVERATRQPLLQAFPTSRLLGKCRYSWPPPAGLFIYSSGALWSSGCPALFATCLFFFQLLVYYSDFFSLGSGQSVQGAMQICPRVLVGVLHAAYLLTWGSVKQVRSWSLAAQEPSWFLHLTLIGDDIYRLGVWRCQNFASSWWFFLPGVSLVSLQDFTWRSMLSASSL